jgi:hypothetical protein
VEALAEEFRDPGSVRFYAHLLWGALCLEDYGLRQGALEVLAWAIGRVREAVATAEFSRRKVLRPGALLASLKERASWTRYARPPSGGWPSLPGFLHPVNL